jgi:hypothetical protein
MDDDDDVNTNLIFEYLLNNIPFELPSKKIIDPSPKHG